MFSRSGNIFVAAAIFILCSGISLSAQHQNLHVVKDNIACLYGLKNDSGQWVVKAQYTTISQQYEYQSPGQIFIAGVGSKYGVMNDSGKIIIPVFYDAITMVPGDKQTCFFILANFKKYGVEDNHGNVVIPFDYDLVTNYKEALSFLFYVQSGKNYGLINHSGKVILPVKYTGIYQDQHYYNFYYFTDSTKKTGLGDASGIILPPEYGAIRPLDYAGTRFIARGLVLNGDGSFRYSRFGVIDRKGDTLLPFVYDEIGYSNYGEKRFTVRNGKTYGVFDDSLKVIIPPGVTIEEPQSYSYSGDPFSFSKQDTLAAKRDQKWGLLAGDGTWITAQDYDSIVYPDYVPHFISGVKFIVKQNGKWGTLGAKGKTMIAPVYDFIKQLSDDDGYSNNYGPGGKDDSYFFLCRQNGKYGIVDPLGKAIVPLVYDTVIAPFDAYNNYRNSYYDLEYNGDLFFTTATSVQVFQRYYKVKNSSYNYASSSSSSCPMQFFFKVNDTLSVYQGHYPYQAFYPAKSGDKKILFPATHIQVLGDGADDDLLDVIIPIQHYYYSYDLYDTLYFDSKTGKQRINPFKGIELTGYFPNENYVFKNKDGKFGVMDKKGKIMVQPIYYGIEWVTPQKGDGTKNYLWVKFSPDTSCVFYEHGFNNSECVCGWTLCDQNFHPLCKTIFDAPFHLLENYQEVFSNGKAGLFDVNHLRFIIPPRYLDIVSISGNPYTMDNPYVHNYNSGYGGTLLDIFYVLRTNGQFGLADKTGHWLTDSTFTWITPIPYRNRILSQGGNTNGFKSERFLLYNDSMRIVMDLDGKIAKDPALVDSLIRQSYELSDFNSFYRYVGDGGGGYPDYMNKGLAVAGYHAFEKQDSSATDSLWLNALESTFTMLVNKYRDRFSFAPATTYFTCACSQSLQNSDNVKVVYTGNTDHQGGGTVSISFLSSEGMSVQTGFNPDTSRSSPQKLDDIWYMNFRKTKSGYDPVTLDSIFCPGVNYPLVLNNLIIKAISKNDRLDLDCNNPKSYFLQTHGKFCFTREGLQVFIDRKGSPGNPVIPIIIPWADVQPYSRAGGIVDDFVGNSNGDHCRIDPDTVDIDFVNEKYLHVKDFTGSDFLKGKNVLKCVYHFDNGKIPMMRVFCAGNEVYEIYFAPVKPKKTICLDCDLSAIPKKIRKAKITKMDCIHNFKGRTN